MRIPNNTVWSQTNDGDLRGILHSTSNVTFDNAGKICLSKRPFVMYDSADDADLSDILGITYWSGDGKYYILTDDELFKGEWNSTTFSEVASVAALSGYSDIQVAYNKVYITRADNWNNSDDFDTTGNLGALTSGVPHPMCVFESQTTDKLAIGDNNQVEVYDSGHNPGQALVLPQGFQVTSLAFSNGYLYVGTWNTEGGEAKVFIWNGNTANVDFGVPVGASYVYSVQPYGQSVACVTSSGELFTINGTTKQPLSAFPVYHKQDTRWQALGNPKVRHRGMAAVGSRIYIMVDGSLESGFCPEMKGGLWVYDPEVGLTHRGALNVDKFVSDSSLSLASNTLTTSAAHNLKTGDAVMFDTTSGLTGVDADVIYYASVESTTTLKLAKSRKSLADGNTMTIGGTPGGSDDLLYIPSTDWGDLTNTGAGAVLAVAHNESLETAWQSEVVFGSVLNDKSGSSYYAVYGLNSSFNIGTVETQRIYTGNAQQAWKNLYLFIEGLTQSNEEIIVKYRTDEKIETPIMQGTWSDADSIASASGTVDEDPFDDVETGYELVLTGYTGRGYSAHVDSISGSFTYNIDESLGTATDTVEFYATNYKKLGSFTSTRELQAAIKAVVDQPAIWIQFKIEMRGYDICLAMMELTNSVSKSTV